MKRSYEKEVVERVKEIDGCSVMRAGTVRNENSVLDIYSVHRIGQNPEAKNVFLSAGLHGDEPAAVYALLKFFEEGVRAYKGKLNFFAIPCINPFGFEQDTRENHHGVDLNRNFASKSPEQEVGIVKKVLERYSRQYLFTLDMHEDPTDTPVPGFELKDCPKDFYMYEISPDKEKSIGHRIISRLEADGIPAAKQEKLYHDLNDGGLVWRQSSKDRLSEEQSQLFDYLQRYTDFSFTTETPTCRPLDNRIDVHLMTLEIIIKEIDEKAK